MRSRDRKLFVVYEKGLLTVSVEDVDLRDVLTAVSEKTGVSTQWLRNLEKRVTIEFRGAPLERGLRRILRGVSYALIYSPSDEQDGPEMISGVFVLSDQPRGRRTSRRALTRTNVPKTEEERRAYALEKYERRLDVLDQRMAGLDKDSRQGKAIMRQIRQLENKIEELLEQ